MARLESASVASGTLGSSDGRWSPERLIDRLQIQEVLYLYCRAIDRIQLDILHDVFHPDALIDKGGGKDPLEIWIANVAARHPGVPRASHMVSNFLIDFLGPDSAFVESWCLALEQHPCAAAGGRDLDRIHRVRYGDRFERRAGAWRIAERTFVTDHMMGVEVRSVPDWTGRNVGHRGAADRILAMRTALGL